MNTPAHVIFAAAAFARPHDRRRTWAAIAGALLPDLSLYVMAGVALFGMGLSPEYVFDTLYFSDGWQRVFAIDNSIVLWSLGLVLCWWRGWGNGLVFAMSGLLHLVLDFALHHDDARAHFWPLSDWVFASPLSYWDRSHFGSVVGPVEMAVSAVLCLVLLRRFAGTGSRIVIGCVAALELAPVFVWAYVFATG